MLLDLICLNIAFVIAYRIRISTVTNPYAGALYRDMLIILCLADLLTTSQLSLYNGFARRGYYKEFIALTKQSIIVFSLGALYLFSVKDAHKFSRITFFLMALFFFFLSYVMRLLWKRIKRKYQLDKISSLLIISDRHSAMTAVPEMISRLRWNYSVCGLALTDTDLSDGEINGVPVLCSAEQVPEYVCHNWVDDVLIIGGDTVSPELLNDLSETGVVIHLHISGMETVLGQKQFMDNIGGVSVITSCMKEAQPLEILIKRLGDVLGGLVGCVVTVLLFLFLAPAIKISSPGPIFFEQKRVGRNGKVFNMYKFRSMHTDAEERKKELVTANRVSDGMMFKLDFDPRIIGNEVLPDGSRKTGVGNFIRRTSLDEFPQFFNVLKGDMSIVGTRPPTLDEYEKYELHHRARLSIKPGVTGMWQISGRSNITDFEEVVKLDTKYINEWSIGMDIKIILKTIGMLFRGDGAM
ncbi:MAG: sugar transferase [Eubacteriales bacterium]|nr:sugar transferase [Eubacteriales bacterium]